MLYPTATVWQIRGYTPHVTKVNSKTTLRVDLALIEGLSESERARLLEKLGSRLVGASTGPDGAALPGTELLIQVQNERSQLVNRGLAVERASTIIIKALHRDMPRRATKPSQERRVASIKWLVRTRRTGGDRGWSDTSVLQFTDKTLLDWQ